MFPPFKNLPQTPSFNLPNPTHHHPLRTRYPPNPLIRRRKDRRNHPRHQIRPPRYRPRSGPPRHHHRPPQQASRQRLHPHPRRGPGRRPQTLPQKKTGRARLGSQRTPLRPGGGVVFDPKPKDWSVKINNKEKRLAISTALASAAVNGIVVEEFGEKVEKPKTKEFISVMKRWGIDPKEKSMFLMTEVSENLELSSWNIGTCKMLTPRTLNLLDILNADKLVFTKGAVDYLNDMYGYEEEYEDEDDEVDFEVEAEGETKGTGTDEAGDASE